MKRHAQQLTRLSLLIGALAGALALGGCSGDDGAPGMTTGTLNGVVTNSSNSGAPLSGATVTLDPAPPGVSITTAANGSYSAVLPVGFYTVTWSATNFDDVTSSVSVLGGITTTRDVGLTPVSPVVLTASGAPSNPSPGASFNLSVSATPLDGSSIVGYSWTQTHSAMATIMNATSSTATITLGNAAAYKAAVVEEVDPQDRWGLLGFDPFAIEEGGLVTFECEVTTTSGTYAVDVDVHAHLDFVDRATGLRNVATDVPVLLNGRVQASYDWALTPPGGSAAALNDATERHAWFVPDVAGLYTVSVTQLSDMSTVNIEIYAGEWVGAINGQDMNGRPTVSCTSCHSAIFPEKFTEWAATGHAEIFKNNLNEGGHYGEGCFSCHMVGYNAAADNAGADDTTGYGDFLATLFPGGNSVPNANNYATVLASFPEQGRMANVQCESCHGPNGMGGGHISGHAMGDPRVSASPMVCAVCHGEPPRHARFQQWQLSGHGNYELAIDEGTSGSCAKCHTAEGFLQWEVAGFSTAFNATPGPVDQIEPITCVVCHDPHNVGTRSGDDNDVVLRVENNSPALLGGFTAHGIGNGATCIICHNTRRGRANDVAGLADPGSYDRAPHGGAQGDILMGENAFFVTVGARGGHSYISNTCTTCHMAITDPPADLSYNLSGTNHTFAADPSICAQCHGDFTADALIALTDARLEDLKTALESAILAEIRFHTDAPNNDTVTVGSTPITAATVINSIELTESHGRAAMTIDIGGTVETDAQISGDTSLGAGGTLLDNAVASNNGLTLAKALWNYFIVHNDSSHGVHNPEFVNDVIVATEARIEATWP